MIERDDCYFKGYIPGSSWLQVALLIWFDFQCAQSLRKPALQNWTFSHDKSRLCHQPATSSYMASTSFRTTRKTERNVSQSDKDRADTDTPDVNSLLNFYLPPRNTTNPLSFPIRRSRRVGTTRAVWNKESCVWPMSHSLIIVNFRCRVRECSVSIRHESNRRLHRSLCWSRHVCSLTGLHSKSSLSAFHLVIFNGRILLKL